MEKSGRAMPTKIISRVCTCPPCPLGAGAHAMNMCTSKSNLFSILKLLWKSTPEKCHRATPVDLQQLCVAVVYWMAELQGLVKTIEITTSAELSKVFTSKIQNKYWKYDEVHIVFHSYHECSIRNLTRNRLLHGEEASQYKIGDITNYTDITNVSLNKL